MILFWEAHKIEWFFKANKIVIKFLVECSYVIDKQYRFKEK